MVLLSVGVRVFGADAYDRLALDRVIIGQCDRPRKLDPSAAEDGIQEFYQSRLNEPPS